MDKFFTQTKCDRCGGSLQPARTTSWFTEETICMTCSSKEHDIKMQLQVQGKGTMEGCGYVPKIEVKLDAKV